MREEKNNLCVHILPGNSHVISGEKSTLRKTGDEHGWLIAECQRCRTVINFRIHERFIRVQSSAAAGIRQAQVEQHARDLLQPYDRYGKENRKFTDEFGWNPYAPEKSGINRQPNERSGGNSGSADNGAHGPLPTGAV